MASLKNTPNQWGLSMNMAVRELFYNLLKSFLIPWNIIHTSGFSLPENYVCAKDSTRWVFRKTAVLLERKEKTNEVNI